MKETGRLFGRHGSLLGITTESSETVTQHCPVIILNAGIIHRAGPSRFSVGLARALAQAGHRVLRFDLAGIGDSRLSLDEGSLEEVVQRDIADAIELMDAGQGVVLFGVCSGADNAFYVAADDSRVRGLALIDPTIQRTHGFHRRKSWRRLKSPLAWWNVISGRSIALRLREARQRPDETLPPGYYGLLHCDPSEARDRAFKMRQRGVKFLYIFTEGAHYYCNHPDQLLEAFPDCFNLDDLAVEWQPQMDHLLHRLEHRRWCEQRICKFAGSVTPDAKESRPADLLSASFKGVTHTS